MSEGWGVALVGAGQISALYARAWERIPGARVRAVASRGLESAQRLARLCGAPQTCRFEDLDALLADPSIDVVCVNSPNRLHAEHALAALHAGKHVIVEKPLCLTLADADRLVATAARLGRGLAYAENLCFAPRYRRARRLVRDGAVGEVLRAHHSEKHGGPYSPWFWQIEEAGGGALLDLGCHGIECLRWLLGKPPIERVSATLATTRHGQRTRLEDEAVVRLASAGDVELVSESSWAIEGPMQSTLELHGTEDVLELDLMGGRGLRLRSSGRELGGPPGDRLEEEGYPMELAHFLDRFRRGEPPEESGRDGRQVLEILLAAYASAGRGAPVELPFDPAGVERPVELWLGARES
ncbi:MAG: Gfo/Idh/MocA family protein [Myxococcota bacterium]